MKKDQTKFEEEIIKNFGNYEVTESQKNWNSYSKFQKQEVLQEGDKIFAELAKLKNEGYSNDSNEVKSLMILWHKFLLNFYTPSIEVMRGLSEMYIKDNRFKSKFQKIDPDLPDFLHKSINNYVNELEEVYKEKQKTTLSQTE
ncbi:TipAS antibiotic-recognition domain-containing protein [Lactobacillus gasseri]|uniref:TipAS antibiotic-recognition domain-containing protein n=1 Tax=Lactobacillus gasseri TaxID=1596 RepID=UPI003A804432